MKKSDLECDNIEFFVYSSNRLLKDEPVGFFEIDLTSIYFNKGHELYAMWFTLTDPNNKIEGCVGYLKCTIELLGPGDEPCVHEAITKQDPDSIKKNLFMSKKVPLTGHMFIIDVFRAENLLPMDLLSGNSDAFLVAKMGNFTVKTKVVTSLNPEWNETLYLPVMFPTHTKCITLQLWDKDFPDGNDLMATYKVNIIPFKNKLTLPAFWVNFYGPPFSGSGVEADRMAQSGKDIGSHYRGRILLRIGSRDEKDPDPSVKPMVFKLPEFPYPSPPERIYVLRVSLFVANDVPSMKQGLIHISFGPHLMISKTKEVIEGRIVFMAHLEDRRVQMPTRVGAIPDVIIYLADQELESRRHCFARIPAEKILVTSKRREGTSAYPRMWKLKEDRSLDLVSDNDFPGFLFASVQLLAFNPTKRPPGDIPVRFEKFQLRAFVFCARELPAADETGTNDAFVKVTCGGKTAQTKVQKKTNNPGWWETLTIDVDLPLAKISPLSENEEFLPTSIALKVFDEDIGRNDLIGRYWVMANMNKKKKVNMNGKTYRLTLSKPRWYNLVFDATGDSAGKVLFSYVFLPFDVAHEFPLTSLYPEHQTLDVSCLVMGLRSIADDFNYSKASFKVDVSDDKHPPYKSPRRKMEGGCMSIFEKISLKLDYMTNPSLASVIDITAYGRLMNSKKLIGVGTVSTAYIFDYLYSEDATLIDKFEKDYNDFVKFTQIPDAFEDDSIVEEKAKKGKNEMGLGQIEEAGEKEEKRKQERLFKVAMRRNQPQDEMGSLESLMITYFSEKLSENEREIHKMEKQKMKMERRLKRREKEAEQERLKHVEEMEPEDKKGINAMRGLNFFKTVNNVKEEDKRSLIPDSILGELNDRNERENVQPPKGKFVQSIIGGNIEGDGENDPLINSKEEEAGPQKGENGQEPSGIINGKLEEEKGEGDLLINQENISQDNVILIDKKSNEGEMEPPQSARPGEENIMDEAGVPLFFPFKFDPDDKSAENLNQVLANYKKENFSIATKEFSSHAVSLASLQGESQVIQELEMAEDNKNLFKMMQDIQNKARAKHKAELKLKKKKPGCCRRCFQRVIAGKEWEPPIYADFDSDGEEDYDPTPPYLKGRPEFQDDFEDSELFKETIEFVEKFPLVRGAVRGDLSEMPRNVGFFKCIFLRPMPNISLDSIEKKLMEAFTPKDFLCRVYILKGVGIRSLQGEGDPECYLKVKMAGKVIDDEDNVVAASKNPEFYKHFDLKCKIPGNCSLRIEVWNKLIGTDELLGFTTVDLERRYFNPGWKKTHKKPIEKRLLTNDIFPAMGRLEMWIDLISNNSKKSHKPPEPIQAGIQDKFELRVIVWECREFAWMDVLEKCSDLYVMGGFPGKKMYETDVHWRARGTAPFEIFH